MDSYKRRKPNQQTSSNIIGNYKINNPNLGIYIYFIFYFKVL